MCPLTPLTVKMNINTHGAPAHAQTHQTPLTQRVDRARGMISDPCCMKPPTGNHRLFPSVYWFSSRSLRSRRHGWGLYHSYGLNLTQIHTHTGREKSYLFLHYTIKGTIFLMENKTNTLIKAMIVSRFWVCWCAFVCVPSRKKKHTADSEVSQQHEEPNSRWEGIQEGEITWLPTLRDSGREREVNECNWRKESGRNKSQKGLGTLWIFNLLIT